MLKKDHRNYSNKEAMNSVGFSGKEFCYLCQIRKNFTWGIPGEATCYWLSKLSLK